MNSEAKLYFQNAAKNVAPVTTDCSAWEPDIPVESEPSESLQNLLAWRRRIDDAIERLRSHEELERLLRQADAKAG